MKIIMQKVSELIPYVNNPRNNTDAIDKVASSIKNYGFRVPIVVDKNNEIITGHTRLLASKKLGLEEVPTIVADDMTPAQVKAFRLVDNKVSEYATWDIDKLNIELEELNEMNIDLIDFDLETPEEEKDVEEDDFEMELPKEPYSKCGDIWILGQHRLMCGDSTNENDIKILVDNNPIFLINTDPPYGMNAVTKSGVLSKKYKTDIIGDDDNTIAIKSFEICQKLFNTSNQVWWGANYYTECLPSSECWIVWDKNNGTSDQTDCELAWANFRSVVRQFTLSSEKKNRVHPTQKPVKLFEWIIKKFDKQDTFKTILDLFGGSGFTLIGAEQMGKTSFTMEFDTKYVDIIVNRYYKYIKDNNINKEIKLIRDGKEYKLEETKVIVGE